MRDQDLTHGRVAPTEAGDPGALARESDWRVGWQIYPLKQRHNPPKLAVDLPSDLLKE